MDREQAKNIWPIIKSLAEGKQVEIKTKEGSYWDIFEADDIQYIDFKKCNLCVRTRDKNIVHLKIQKNVLKK